MSHGAAATTTSSRDHACIARPAVAQCDSTRPTSTAGLRMAEAGGCVWQAAVEAWTWHAGLQQRLLGRLWQRGPTDDAQHAAALCTATASSSSNIRGSQGDRSQCAGVLKSVLELLLLLLHMASRSCQLLLLPLLLCLPLVLPLAGVLTASCPGVAWVAQGMLAGGTIPCQEAGSSTRQTGWPQHCVFAYNGCSCARVRATSHCCTEPQHLAVLAPRGPKFKAAVHQTGARERCSVCVSPQGWAVRAVAPGAG